MRDDTCLAVLASSQWDVSRWKTPKAGEAGCKQLLKKLFNFVFGVRVKQRDYSWKCARPAAREVGRSLGRRSEN